MGTGVYRFKIPRRLRGERQTGERKQAGVGKKSNEPQLGEMGKRAPRNTHRRHSEVRKQHYYYELHTTACSTPDLEILLLIFFFFPPGQSNEKHVSLSYIPYSPCTIKRRTSTAVTSETALVKKSHVIYYAPGSYVAVVSATVWRRRSSNSPSSSFTNSLNLIVITPCYQPSSGHFPPLLRLVTLYPTFLITLLSR